uniref:Uncharacterized protein n=1 Tax=Oncorhynchus mykiss TaxID=8022 RepID=A0A8K9XGM6_ONCMY
GFALPTSNLVIFLFFNINGLSPFRDISIKPACQECQVSLHSETSVSSLSVRVPGLSPFRDISIKPICQSARSLSIQRHQYQAYLSRVPGLSPFRDISIKPICQECQVSLHSETSVSSLPVKSARSLSIQRHQYQACLSRVPGLSPFRDISIKPACQECQVSLHSETSVSSLPVKSARSLSIQRHQYQACLSRVPGLSPFRDISIKPSARSLSIQRHQYQAYLSECQVSLHSETSVSSLSVRVPGLSPFRDISIKPACQECQVSLHSETSVSSLPVKSARSLSIQRHQYQACLSRVPGLSPFRDISIKPIVTGRYNRQPSGQLHFVV